MQSSIRARALTGLALIVAILVCLALVSYSNNCASVRNSRWAKHTNDVLLEISGTLVALADAEKTSYVSTGDESRRETFQTVLSRVREHIDSLRGLILNNPAQQERFALLEPHIVERLKLLQEGADLRQKRNAEVSPSLLQSGRGEIEMNQIYKIAAEMSGEEESILQRAEASEHPRDAWRGFFVAGLLLASVFPCALLYSVQRDIGEVVRAGKKLQDSESRVGALLEAAPVGVMGINKEGRILLANAHAEKIFGYSRGELLGMHMVALIPEEFRARHARHQAAYLVNPQLRPMGAERLLQGRRKDGSSFPVEIGINVIKRDDDLLITAIIEDITKRMEIEKELLRAKEELEQRVEERTTELYRANQDLLQQVRENKKTLDALRESQQRVSLHMMQTPLAAIEWNLNYEVVEWNPAAEKMFGYTRDEALGRHASFIVAEDVRQHTEEVLKNLVAGTGGARSTNENVTKEGKTILCEWYNTSLVDKDGRVVGIASLANDVTDYRKLEEQVRQSQRMEAVGRLAGGIAHDFNNLLGVILGYTDILQDAMPGNDPQRIRTEKIKNAGQRAASLVRQLLAFSRKQVLEPRVVNLNEMLQDMEHMLRRLITENIELQIHADPALKPVKVDPAQMEQVILNLVINARDAMPNGGKLTLETCNVTRDAQSALNQFASAAGEYVMLAVTDTGSGMDKATQARIFEPFFTTKERGKGTGLGLSSVYGIVKQSAGYITVHSEAGRGTSFTVYLPRADEAVPAPAAPASQQRKKKEVKCTETILVVEDDEALRGLTSDFLRSKGYTVLAASNGAEAISLVERPETVIDLLLSDVVMPGMSGPGLARKLAEMRPQLKVLCVSGYMQDSIVQDGELGPGMELLQKPYRLSELASRIRSILDRSSTDAG